MQVNPCLSHTYEVKLDPIDTDTIKVEQSSCAIQKHKQTGQQYFREPTRSPLIIHWFLQYKLNPLVALDLSYGCHYSSSCNKMRVYPAWKKTWTIFTKVILLFQLLQTIDEIVDVLEWCKMDIILISIVRNYSYCCFCVFFYCVWWVAVWKSEA